MQPYRAYVIRAKDGWIKGPPVDLECDSDMLAIAKALVLMMRGIHVELWQGSRKVCLLTDAKNAIRNLMAETSADNHTLH